MKSGTRPLRKEMRPAVQSRGASPKKARPIIHPKDETQKTLDLMAGFMCAFFFVSLVLWLFEVV